MEPIILPRISDQKPLVSVISITYNHGPYIRDCLEGFLMQKTDFPVEYIIHDDASTDHTADIIREYYEKRPDLFHVIIERENIYGRKPIMQPLYDQAKGKYIALCEGDDYWTDPLKLQKQFDFLEKNNEYIAIVHRYDVVNKNGIKQDTITFGHYTEDQAGKYTIKDFENDLGLPSQIASMMFMKYPLFCEDLSSKNLKKVKTPGDTKLFFLLLLHGNIYRMKETMSAYRYVREINGGSYSSRAIKQFDPFKTWENYIRLEMYAKEEYGKEVYLKRRRENIGKYMIITTIRNLNYTNIKNLLNYFANQKGATKCICQLFREVIRRIFKGKHRTEKG